MGLWHSAEEKCEPLSIFREGKSEAIPSPQYPKQIEN